MHNRLFELIDLSRLGKVSEERVRHDVALATRRILDEQRVLLTLEERERIVIEIQDEVFGLGPLEPLLADPTVSDILVNGHAPGLRRAPRPARAHRRALQGRRPPDAHHRADRVAASAAASTSSNPMVDARLPDGSRVNAIIPPLALDGPMLSIRRFPARPADGRRPGRASAR